jgi:hypothetical protein
MSLTAVVIGRAEGATYDYSNPEKAFFTLTG